MSTGKGLYQSDTISWILWQHYWDPWIKKLCKAHCLELLNLFTLWLRYVNILKIVSGGKLENSISGAATAVYCQDTILLLQLTAGTTILLHKTSLFANLNNWPGILLIQTFRISKIQLWNSVSFVLLLIKVLKAFCQKFIYNKLHQTVKYNADLKYDIHSKG